MILRDTCIFRARRSTLDRWSGKNTKRIGTRPSALQSTFHFWKTSRRIASLLMLSTSKIEVSQNYCVFDAVKFESWGNLRIAAFLMLSISKTEEVSQNIFVFRFADRQIDSYRQTDKQTASQPGRQTDNYNYNYQSTTTTTTLLHTTLH